MAKWSAEIARLHDDNVTVQVADIMAGLRRMVAWIGRQCAAVEFVAAPVRQGKRVLAHHGCTLCQHVGQGGGSGRRVGATAGGGTGQRIGIDSGRIAAPSQPLSSSGGRQGLGRIGTVAKDVVHRAQGAAAICHVGDQRRQQPVGVVYRTGLVQVARLLPVRAMPREQVAQAAMARAVHRIGQHRHAAAQVRMLADDRLTSVSRDASKARTIPARLLRSVTAGAGPSAPGW